MKSWQSSKLQENKYMTNEKVTNVNKPKAGSWDNLSLTSPERKPKVKFEINKPVIITLTVDSPREIFWEDSTFYVFECTEGGEERSLSTSAWSLLRGLKAYEPLNGKTLRITKEMIKGKQNYKVETNEVKI